MTIYWSVSGQRLTSQCYWTILIYAPVSDTRQSLYETTHILDNPHLSTGKSVSTLFRGEITDSE